SASEGGKIAGGALCRRIRVVGRRWIVGIMWVDLMQVNKKRRIAGSIEYGLQVAVPDMVRKCVCALRPRGQIFGSPRGVGALVELGEVVEATREAIHRAHIDVIYVACGAVSGALQQFRQKRQG